MLKRLVIVESPAKARTIAGYLGADYAVESSVGHIRDLPDRASDVPEAQRKRFGALGVDVAKGFEPYYLVDPGKKKIVTALKKRLSEADELLLATDEDREGEAIAWHLVEVLVRNPGRLVTQRQLLQEVWGPQYEKETNYLRVYLAQIRKKLEPDPARPRYFITEARMGYRFVPAG